ncbi:hypothetical protein PSC71_07595 [Devosia sp. J2-20]|uniref:hypothetical protein n=1 Tax=Devosia sp. J2-20 TaxID=3026161 RepID=UPI00249ADFC5|nr:hypothetical protein [Devosia sp. J2-20]WDR00607.1 hypothetical protein PSC71_07595 [Devosia sp. J2-20]
MGGHIGLGGQINDGELENAINVGQHDFGQGTLGTGKFVLFGLQQSNNIEHGHLPGA